jgi:DUF1009 family protein
MATSMPGPLAIIAGGGALPLHVAEAARSQGRAVYILGFKGEADPGIGAYDHVWLDWSMIGNVTKLIIDYGAREVVLIGGIRARPDFRQLKLDLATMRLIKEAFSFVIGGDNNVLVGAVRTLEKRGLRVLGAHEVAADLVAGPGPLGRLKPDRASQKDLNAAMRAAHTIGILDAGQAAVSVNSRIIALEGAEGTDAMLGRVLALREEKRISWRGRAGVLAKCAKPQQDLRVDMPTIGPKTVDAAAAAGLAGIAIEAGRVMIFDRKETARRADAAGLFVVGVAPDIAAA